MARPNEDLSKQTVLIAFSRFPHCRIVLQNEIVQQQLYAKPSKAGFGRESSLTTTLRLRLPLLLPTQADYLRQPQTLPATTA
jgi:hypothetical protein